MGKKGGGIVSMMEGGDKKNSERVRPSKQRRPDHFFSLKFC